MSARSRLLWLETQLERDDLTDIEFNSYNQEANFIQADLNKIKEQQRQIKEQRLKEEAEEQELTKALALTESEVDKMYEDSCLKYQDVNGISFKQWYEKSLKYYTIDERHSVHAKARSSNTVEIIEHVSLAQAKLTILKRIKYKFYDHAIRDRDFAYDIDNEL